MKSLYSMLAALVFLCAAQAQAANPETMGARRVPLWQNQPASQTDNATAPLPKQTYATSWKEFEKPANVNVSAGYRVDNLDWNIATDTTGTQTPNILSELKWKNVRSYELRGEGAIRIPEGWLEGLYMNASGYRGWITAGKNQDSDYIENNRSNEFSRSNNDANDGSTMGASGALGYAFQWRDAKPADVLQLITMAGYSYNKQRLKMTNGNQTVTGCGTIDIYFVCGAPLGPFAGLDSGYDARWKGPFLGLDASMKFNKRHYIRLKGQYHWASYHGVGNWNLRDDFLHPRSFEHDADGSGFLLGLMYAFNITDDLSLSLEGEYQRFSTDPGNDTTYFNVLGIFPASGTTRLNEVNWDSKALRAGLNYSF